MRIIDLHVHVFPDRVAKAALPRMEHNAGVEAVFDGTVTGLLAAMRRGGVERSVVQPVATRADSVAGINDWAASIQDDRISAFGAIHPDHPEASAEIERLASLGLRGVKLHPEFQAFRPDEDRMAPLYEAFVRHDLIVFFHAGEDLAMPTVSSTPQIFARVSDAYPRMRLVLAHMGGWRQWDAVLDELVGRDLLLETSYTLGYAGPERFVELVQAHGAGRVVFGSDGPWADAGTEARAVAELGLDESEVEAILWRNAERLLARTGSPGA